METHPEPLAGLHILVVEDETMVALMLEDMLLDLGCSVDVAPSVETALDVIRTQTLHGVLLDMNMHGQTTISVAEELANRSMPFLLVTGYGPRMSEPAVVKTAPRLTKPFSIDDLTRRMTEVFAHA